MFSSSGSFRAHCRPNKHSVLPVSGLVDQRNPCRSAPPEQYGGNRDAFRGLPLWVNYRTLTGRCAKPMNTKKPPDLPTLTSVTNEYLELGWAAGDLLSLLHFCPLQSVMVTPDWTSSSMPSQKTPPSLVEATLVKSVLLKIVFMAIGLLLVEVPGATPKNPFSGLMALSWPFWSKRIQAMSSPTHSTLNPGKLGVIMAKLVLPQAEGKAAAM